MSVLTAILLMIFVPAIATADDRRVHFGVQLAPENVTYDEIVTTWKLLENLGYDSAWLNDHFMPFHDRDQSHFESWTTLAALATQTERIRIGILVSGNTYRHPAVLAKMATTVDYISRGRLNFGIGAGWAEHEHRAYGIPYYTARERAERLGEALEVITQLWGASHPTVTGKYYRLLQAPFAPKSLQRPRPPIVIGGQGKKWIMPIVARYADEWNVPVGVSPAGVRERLAIIRAECKRIRRDPCVRDVSVFLLLAGISDVPPPLPPTEHTKGAAARVARSVLSGSAEHIKTRINEYIDVGVTSVIITTRPVLDHTLMRRFAEEIVPAFRTPSPRRS